jgi:DNA-directed RNA polymerase specialized sigma24 family protein
MPPLGEGSVTRWIADVRAGDDSAVQKIWERYFHQLVERTRRKLRTIARRAVEGDEEDAALCAFDSLCRGMACGQFPHLNNRDDLARLLFALSVHKALHQIEREKRQKRGGNKLLRESDLRAAEDAGEGAVLDSFTGDEPTPEFSAIVTETYHRLRERLGDDELRTIFDLRLEGYSRKEISDRLGCTVRTITRKLDVIRETWLGQDDLLRRVLELRLEGLTPQEIAETLGCGVRTVANKLGLISQSWLVGDAS